MNEEESKCGEHTLGKRIGKGWRCTRCMREAWTQKGRNRLRRIPCVGDPSVAVHESHSLHITGGVLWCMKCGAHTKIMPLSLTRECVGGPRSGAYKNVIKRLGAGKMPTQQQDRETEKTGAWKARPWEHSGGRSGSKMARKREDDALNERIAMDNRMAMKKRRLSQAQNPQQGTVDHTKRIREQAREAIIRKRRRVTDKNAVEKEACAMLAAGKWVHRICPRVDNRTEKCMVCGSTTRTRCRVCTRPLCMSCAKLKAQCRCI